MVQPSLFSTNDLWRVTVRLESTPGDPQWCIARHECPNEAAELAVDALTAYLGEEAEWIETAPYKESNDPGGYPDFLNQIVEGVWI